MEQELKEHFLVEQIKTIENLCEIAHVLIDTGNRHLLATCLELLYEQAQDIVDENCILV